MWRLLGFDIHYLWPPVERLQVHLPLQNIVQLEKDTKLKNIVQDHKYKTTKLTEWFQTNILYEDARDLTYCDFPKFWRWDEGKRKWNKRKNGYEIGRLYYVNPTEGE